MEHRASPPARLETRALAASGHDRARVRRRERLREVRGLAEDRGAALFVDYGFDGASPGDTLRGFRRHEQVHPLAEPGLVDLTVDADFGACARHGASVDGARVFGSTTQGEWLQRMGIVARLEALLVGK